MDNDVATKHERTVIEQSTTSVAVPSSDQILAVIERLHACYDYCAAWKQPTQEEATREEDHPQQGRDRADVTQVQGSQ
jgi:hypothetical protein